MLTVSDIGCCGRKKGPCDCSAAGCTGVTCWSDAGRRLSCSSSACPWDSGSPCSWQSPAAACLCPPFTAASPSGSELPLCGQSRKSEALCPSCAVLSGGPAAEPSACRPCGYNAGRGAGRGMCPDSPPLALWSPPLPGSPLPLLAHASPPKLFGASRPVSPAPLVLQTQSAVAAPPPPAPLLAPPPSVMLTVSPL